MQQWPFIISNPHCGELAPQYLLSRLLLSKAQIIKDGDEQAQAIYSPLKALCLGYHEAIVARAFVDLNRRADDFSKDGVIKTHTCWDEPIYTQPLDQNQIERLLQEYYHQYHRQLQAVCLSKGASWLFDCHTMAEYPPPVAPDHTQKRPLVCLGNGDGQGCPAQLFDKVVAIFNDVFDGQVSQNKPFSGGYICRRYGRYLPSVQIELSRTLDMSIADKSSRIQDALAQVSRL